ncbi:MATE family efflux transporter [Niallia hominis]|uniref:MATE family efflux transporter n=1 Tax=Niallia hominis TaxID=3133173 RepID=A0ABV1F7K4_9BACI
MSAFSQASKIFKEKVPIHLIVAGSAWISRIITAGINLISLRILTDGLGTQNYSVFALITGLMGWYLLVDLGMGASLQNYISELRAKGQDYYKYIKNVTLLSLGVGLIFILALYIFSPFLSGIFLKQFNFLSDTEKSHVFFIAGALYVVFTLASVSYKIWYAEMKGYLSNILPAVASIITLIGISIVSYTDIADKLFWSLVAFIGPTSLIAAISLWYCLSKAPKSSWKIDKNIIKNIYGRGFHFWFFAIMSAVVLQIDYIVMSQYASSEDIVIYNITAKIYALVFFIYNAVLMALWPVFTETATKGKWQEVKKYLKKYTLYGILFIVVSVLGLILLMPLLISLVSPNLKIEVPILFIAIMGLYYIVRVWTDTYATFLQSMSSMKTFWIWTPLQAICSLVLQLIFVPKYSIYGILIGLIGSYLLTVLWAVPMSVYRIINIKQKQVKQID